MRSRHREHSVRVRGCAWDSISRPDTDSDWMALRRCERSATTKNPPYRGDTHSPQRGSAPKRRMWHATSPQMPQRPLTPTGFCTKAKGWPQAYPGTKAPPDPTLKGLCRFIRNGGYRFLVLDRTTPPRNDERRTIHPLAGKASFHLPWKAVRLSLCLSHNADARMVESVDTGDLKSLARKGVRVQVPLRAPL